MSPVIEATATKPTPATKLGLKYVVQNNNCVRITVEEGGLLSMAGLEEGQEIIAVNGTCVEGTSKEEMMAIFASIETEVVIKARPQSFKACYNDRPLTTKYQVDWPQKILPRILESAGVPLYKWQKIHNAMQSEMASAICKSDQMDKIFQREMANYTQKQMGKGYVGFGQESHHEKKVFHMVHQCAVLANNATLAATDISIRANALLAPHGIMVGLVLKSTRLPKYSTKQKGEGYVVNKPCGLEFMSVE